MNCTIRHIPSPNLASFYSAQNFWIIWDQLLTPLLIKILLNPITIVSTFSDRKKIVTCFCRNPSSSNFTSSFWNQSTHTNHTHIHNMEHTLPSPTSREAGSLRTPWVGMAERAVSRDRYFRLWVSSHILTAHFHVHCSSWSMGLVSWHPPPGSV